MALERTLGIIKPDSVAAGHTGSILTIIEQNGFRIIGMKMRRLSQREAEAFYEIHKARQFFPGLVQFMTEGPVLLLALEREGGVSKWREVMGATNPVNAADGTIRKRFAENIERNSVHGSDAIETAAQELPFFFSLSELL
jgi:nucleoside-diphosphate kinase